jgi:hypothetical protein
MKNDEDALQCYRGPELMTSDYWVNIEEEWTFKKTASKTDQKGINDGSFQREREKRSVVCCFQIQQKLKGKAGFKHALHFRTCSIT